MRKFFIISILILATFRLFAQDFGAIGTEWYYSQAQSAPTNSEYIYLESVADTVIAGQTTHRITQTYYKYSGDTAQFDPIYVYQQSDTVFMYSPERSRFITLYIFNGKQGDTLTLDAPFILNGIDTTYRLVIDTIINAIVDGVPLRKYGTANLDDIRFHNNGGYFMDRIGGLDWFFPRTETIPEVVGPIRCYVDTEIDTSFQAVACDHRLIASITDIIHGLDIKIYPNPVNNLIYIEISNPNKISDFILKISDFTGRQIKKFIPDKSIEFIDVSCFKPGIYFINIQNSKTQIIKTLKFIKK